MKSKLIVALDVDEYEQAAQLVRALAGTVDVFKVGSQLFTRVGPKIIEFINGRGKQVFLDLKFHDIPNTVAKAVAAAGALHVRMLTVHASGGAEMLQAAARVPNRPQILGVTVLTSVAGDVSDRVVELAKLAEQSGLDGVIASPQEVRPIRDATWKDFLVVTPGIRPAGSETGDQQRVMTPREAIAAGASYIVVGRPIIAAADPLKAALQITEDIANVTG